MEKTAHSPQHISRTTERRAALVVAVNEVLGPHRNVTLEVGSGHGHFLTAYAAAHPDRFCLGIDMIQDRLQRSERKKARAALPNLTFLRAEAKEFLETFPVGVQLEDIFLLFPDPWPKRRHHKNRLLQAEFLSLLASHSKTGARLCFRTDHAEYFEASLKEVQAHRSWSVTIQPWPFELATVFQARAESFQSWIAVRN